MSKFFGGLFKFYQTVKAFFFDRRDVTSGQDLNSRPNSDPESIVEENQTKILINEYSPEFTENSPDQKLSKAVFESRQAKSIVCADSTSEENGQPNPVVLESSEPVSTTLQRVSIKDVFPNLSGADQNDLTHYDTNQLNHTVFDIVSSTPQDELTRKKPARIRVIASLLQLKIFSHKKRVSRESDRSDHNKSEPSIPQHAASDARRPSNSECTVDKKGVLCIDVVSTKLKSVFDFPKALLKKRVFKGRKSVLSSENSVAQAPSTSIVQSDSMVDPNQRHPAETSDSRIEFSNKSLQTSRMSLKRVVAYLKGIAGKRNAKIRAEPAVPRSFEHLDQSQSVFPTFESNIKQSNDEDIVISTNVPQAPPFLGQDQATLMNLAEKTTLVDCWEAPLEALPAPYSPIENLNDLKATGSEEFQNGLSLILESVRSDDVYADDFRDSTGVHRADFLLPQDFSKPLEEAAPIVPNSTFVEVEVASSADSKESMTFASYSILPKKEVALSTASDNLVTEKEEVLSIVSDIILHSQEVISTIVSGPTSLADKVASPYEFDSTFTVTEIAPPIMVDSIPSNQVTSSDEVNSNFEEKRSAMPVVSDPISHNQESHPDLSDSISHDQASLDFAGTVSYDQVASLDLSDPISRDQEPHPDLSDSISHEQKVSRDLSDFTFTKTESASTILSYLRSETERVVLFSSDKVIELPNTSDSTVVEKDVTLSAVSNLTYQGKESNLLIISDSDYSEKDVDISIVTNSISKNSGNEDCSSIRSLNPESSTTATISQLQKHSHKEATTMEIPQFYFKKEEVDPRIREIAIEVRFNRVFHQLVGDVDLQLLWSIMVDHSNNCPDNLLTMDYEQYQNCLAQLPEKLHWAFKPSLFMQFNKNDMGQISTEDYFGFITEASAFTQYYFYLTHRSREIDEYLTPTELHQVIIDMMPELTAQHEEMQSIANNDKRKSQTYYDFETFYPDLIMRKFLFFHSKTRNGKMSIKSILFSHAWKELCDYRRGLGNGESWCSIENFLGIRDQFECLDEDKNGMLSRLEMAKLGSRLTSRFLTRLFDSVELHYGEIDYRTFVEFRLALAHLHLPEGIAWVFKILDVKRDNFLDLSTLRYYATDCVNFNKRKIDIEALLTDIYGYANPQCKDIITVKDLEDSYKSDLVIRLLIDHTTCEELEPEEEIMPGEDEVDQENILESLIAKSIGVESSLTRSNLEKNIPILDNSGIGLVESNDTQGSNNSIDICSNPISTDNCIQFEVLSKVPTTELADNEQPDIHNVNDTRSNHSDEYKSCSIHSEDFDRLEVELKNPTISQIPNSDLANGEPIEFHVVIEEEDTSNTCSKSLRTLADRSVHIKTQIEDPNKISSLFNKLKEFDEIREIRGLSNTISSFTFADNCGQSAKDVEQSINYDEMIEQGCGDVIQALDRMLPLGTKYWDPPKFKNDMLPEYLPVPLRNLLADCTNEALYEMFERHRLFENSEAKRNQKRISRPVKIPRDLLVESCRVKLQKWRTYSVKHGKHIRPLVQDAVFSRGKVLFDIHQDEVAAKLKLQADNENGVENTYRKRRHRRS